MQGMAVVTYLAAHAAVAKSRLENNCFMFKQSKVMQVCLFIVSQQRASMIVVIQIYILHVISSYL